MSFLKKLCLAILSGLLLGASWFPPFTFLLFVAWVPLMLITDEAASGRYKKPGGTVFLFAYLAFLIWNIMDTWWTWFASPGGCVFQILANALLMSTAYLVYFKMSQRLRNGSSRFMPAAYWLLIPVWLSFEYAHTNWELSWSWLTMGNAFSAQTNWIQWYEFTGNSGGSLWVLIVNILAYQLIQGTKQEAKSRIIKIAAAIGMPIIISLLILVLYNPDRTKSVKQNIVIVQPNIDPYNDKFFVAYETQLVQVLEQLKDKISNETNYLVFPETFFTENIWENNIEESNSVKFLRDSILKKFPDLMITVGASTYYRFPGSEELSVTARKFADAEVYYDSFNTGLQLDNFGPIQIYHKSKLVPAVERMPYPALFRPLEKLTIDLGGMSGSLGTQEERGVFFNKDKTVGIAPVICFESVFGEYVRDYIKGGANLIFVITNDGWWRDSPGKIQHLNYARLRAIETRCPIARCANTGISCFISEIGEISQATGWWVQDVISGSLYPNNSKTFFVKFGDLISKAALLLTLAAICLTVFRRFRKKNIS